MAGKERAQLTRQSETRNGRTAIIEAAEALFAEYGLHGASFRQISEAAKQKNASAIQYHFGSRDQLVEAVFENRMRHVNPKRLALLEAVQPTGGTQESRALVSTWVWPLAEELRPREEGNHYVQFMARATREKQLVIQLAPAGLMTGWFLAADRLKQLMTHLPEQVIRTRLLAASDQCVNCLAAFEAEQAGASPDFELQVETLIDMITAGLMAPMSEASERAMKKRGERRRQS
jgi:AcrR family transcriptional regulator